MNKTVKRYRCVARKDGCIEDCVNEKSRRAEEIKISGLFSITQSHSLERSVLRIEMLRAFAKLFGGVLEEL